MVNLHDLPADILRDIFSSCEPRSLTETCRYFTEIVYSLPLFSNIFIGPRQQVPHGPPLLRSRLQRISTSLRMVSIGPVIHDIAETSPAEGMCAVLAEFNTEINQLEISAETASIAGSLLCGIFSGFTAPVTFPRLQMLSVQVQLEYFGDYTPIWPQLDLVLARTPEKFPKLQILSLSDFVECIPALHDGVPLFSNIHTLILDGSRAGSSLCVSSVIVLLQNTPLLETLWIKHSIRGPGSTGIPLERGQCGEVLFSVALPSLTNLALSVPGFSSNLLHYIEAPSLRNLHLDASRDPRCWEYVDDPFPWPTTGIEDVVDALVALSRRSINLRRLAITNLCLSEEHWNWLMFAGPPFPRLENLALHGFRQASEDEWTPENECGFNDALLRQCSQNLGLMMSLCRFSLVNCHLPLTSSVLVKALMSRFNGVPNGGFELELDHNGPQFAVDELEKLAQVGVELIRRREGEVKADEWWKRGHGIDPYDSHAY